MEKQSIKAEILADSIERVGNNRITTFRLTFPRFIQSEILTHAMLKSNSASSRAIPFKRMVEMVENDPFIPIKWMKEHKGMQGTEYWMDGEKYEFPVDDRDAINTNIGTWKQAMELAVSQAKYLNNSGKGNVTKQLCNRLLEPFMWHTIILTGTEFENFFALRAHPMAEIHLQDLAYKMLEAYNASTPQELKEGEWHIPFGNDIDEKQLQIYIDKQRIEANKNCGGINIEDEEWIQHLKVQISTAISAQISYFKFGSTDYEDLIDLHDSLVIRPYNGKRGIRELTDPIHASPAVHCAQAMTESEYQSWYKGEGANEGHNGRKENWGWCHSFKGFKSYRSMLPNENSKDSRLIKK